MAAMWLTRHDPGISTVTVKARPYADLNGDYTDFADLLRRRDAGVIATSPDSLVNGLGTHGLPEAVNQRNKI